MLRCSRPPVALLAIKKHLFVWCVFLPPLPKVDIGMSVTVSQLVGGDQKVGRGVVLIGSRLRGQHPFNLKGF